MKKVEHDRFAESVVGIDPSCVSFLYSQDVIASEVITLI